MNISRSPPPDLKPSWGIQPSLFTLKMSAIRKYVGRKVIVPILGREIPVIADDYVDREFGTGALKITPGHDPNDYAIGERHQLPLISVLDESAELTSNGGPYAGLDRFEARKKLWADMASIDLTIKEEPYLLNVPRSQRGGEIIEPMVSTQWFVRIRAAGRRRARGGARRPASTLCQSALQKCITTGSKISRIGASAASCGGGIASRSGTARTAGRRLLLVKTQTTARTAAALTSCRTRTCSTPGSPQVCGPSRPWAGPMTPPITATSIRPPFSRQATTSCSSG